MCGVMYTVADVTTQSRTVCISCATSLKIGYLPTEVYSVVTGWLERMTDER